MDAGVHYGHQTKRWNPKMKPYIFGARNGIYILDLTKTMFQLEKACRFLFELAMDGGEVLFVGTKRQAQETIRTAAESVDMHYVSQRWLGGTLTNNQTIRKRISTMKEIQETERTGELDSRPKKEVASIRRTLNKLQRDLSGIVDMRRMPQALIVVDVQYEDIAVREAKRLNIPVVGIVDTNCNPDGVDYVIPANDDAHRAIKVIVAAICSTIKVAREQYEKNQEEERLAKEQAAKDAAAAAEAEKAAAAEESDGDDAASASAKATDKQVAQKEAPVENG